MSNRQRFLDGAETRPCKFCGGRYSDIFKRRLHEPSCRLVAKYPDRRYREDSERAHRDYGTALVYPGEKP